MIADPSGLRKRQLKRTSVVVLSRHFLLYSREPQQTKLWIGCGLQELACYISRNSRASRYLEKPCRFVATEPELTNPRTDNIVNTGLYVNSVRRNDSCSFLTFAL